MPRFQSGDLWEANIGWRFLGQIAPFLFLCCCGFFEDTALTKFLVSGRTAGNGQKHYPLALYCPPWLPSRTP
jgi:hypothetical protein